MKLTPWYPPEITPIRIGFYQIDLYGEEADKLRISHWNGEKWSWFGKDIEEVKFNGYLERRNSAKFKWRGLARRPK